MCKGENNNIRTTTSRAVYIKFQHFAHRRSRRRHHRDGARRGRRSAGHNARGAEAFSVRRLVSRGLRAWVLVQARTCSHFRMKSLKLVPARSSIALLVT